MEILLIIKTVVALNCLTFLVLRLFLLLTGRLAGKFIYFQDENLAPASTKMTFLCAGCFNQPKAVFEFMQDKLQGENYCYIDYSCWGWNAKSTAKRIFNDWNNSKNRWDNVVFYAISLGVHITHYVEMGMEKSRVKIYAINPCPTVETLRRPLQIALLALSPFFLVFCHLLGFLSAIPLFSTPGGRYSLVLLADQYFELAYGGTKGISKSTEWLILSKNDKLLDNVAVAKTYGLPAIIRQAYFCEITPSVTIYFNGSATNDELKSFAVISTSHADTANFAEIYRIALRGLKNNAKTRRQAEQLL